MLAVAMIALPLVANAQTACCIGSSSNVMYVGNCDCSTSPTLTTVQHWVLGVPGHYALEGTAMTITFSLTDFKYHLLWDAREVDAFDSLRDAEWKGVHRMEDFQKSGFPLK